jgi:hypothetical protein
LKQQHPYLRLEKGVVGEESVFVEEYNSKTNAALSLIFKLAM